VAKQGVHCPGHLSAATTWVNGDIKRAPGGSSMKNEMHFMILRLMMSFKDRSI